MHKQQLTLNAQNSFWIVIFHAFHFYSRMRQAPSPEFRTQNNRKTEQHSLIVASSFPFEKCIRLLFTAITAAAAVHHLLQEHLNGFVFHFTQYTRRLGDTVGACDKFLYDEAVSFYFPFVILNNRLLFSRRKALNRGKKVYHNDKKYFIMQMLGIFLFAQKSQWNVLTLFPLFLGAFRRRNSRELSNKSKAID